MHKHEHIEILKLMNILNSDSFRNNIVKRLVN